jgi:hypothetical protein
VILGTEVDGSIYYIFPRLFDIWPHLHLASKLKSSDWTLYKVLSTPSYKLASRTLDGKRLVR